MIRRLLIAAGLCLALLPGAALAQFQPWDGASVLEDAEWQKRFLGSYGFLSGAEPQVRPTELEGLREVLDLLAVNPKAAKTILAAQVLPDSSAALDFILANLYFQNQELDSAKKYYASALEKFPDFRRAHKNLGLLRVQEGDFAGGLEHLSRAVELGDRDGRNFGLMGYCFLNLDNHLGAEAAYRNAVMQEPETRDWKLGLARSLLAMEKYHEAAALFDTLLNEMPDDATTWMLQANAFVGLEQPMAAAVNLEAVRMLGKAQTSSLVLLGDIYMNEGMYDLARSAYVDAIESDKGATQFDTAKKAADLLIRTQAYGDASEVLNSMRKRYKRMNEDQELEVLTLQAKLARGQGRDDTAAKLLESIVERDGTRGEALLELGEYYRSQGNSEKALLLMERAGRIDEFEYRSLLARAQLLVGEKDYADAAELLRKALRIRQEPRVERFLANVQQAVRPR